MQQQQQGYYNLINNVTNNGTISSSSSSSTSNGTTSSSPSQLRKNKNKNKIGGLLGVISTISVSGIGGESSVISGIMKGLKPKPKKKGGSSGNNPYRTKATLFSHAVLLRTIVIFALVTGLLLVAVVMMSSRSSYTTSAAVVGNDLGDNNNLLSGMSSLELQQMFEMYRNGGGSTTATTSSSVRRTTSSSTTTNTINIERILEAWLSKVDKDIVDNNNAGTGGSSERWTRPYLLPDIIDNNSNNDNNDIANTANSISTSTIITASPRKLTTNSDKYFKVTLNDKKMMAWEHEWDEMVQKSTSSNGIESLGPKVDYTNPDMYSYKYPDPSIFVDKPLPPVSEYPAFQTFREIFRNWKQGDEYNQQDDDNTPIHETLVHFDYNDPKQMKVAQAFRDAELPFKVINVPDLQAANIIWDDDKYVMKYHPPITTITGPGAEVSSDNFFQTVMSQYWDLPKQGIPPNRQVIGMTYTQWSSHARYADAISLSRDKPHYYWTTAVRRMERFLVPDNNNNNNNNKDSVSFITRDLRNSLSSTQPNFFVPDPNRNHGIQCRFGERGVVSELHIDNTKNAVAMISGAKRYLLSPPNQCSKFAMTTTFTQSYLLSALNLGHMSYLDDDDDQQHTTTTSTTTTNGGSSFDSSTIKMSDKERRWLERASGAKAVETVLKAGEVLIIPSQWLHYVIGLQKNAQCNVHIPAGVKGHPVFGGPADVRRCEAM